MPSLATTALVVLAKRERTALVVNPDLVSQAHMLQFQALANVTLAHLALTVQLQEPSHLPTAPMEDTVLKAHQHLSFAQMEHTLKFSKVVLKV